MIREDALRRDIVGWGGAPSRADTLDRAGAPRIRHTRPGTKARRRYARGRCALVLAIGFGAILGACASDEQLQTPLVTRSPWEAERTWAVVPFSNESGVSTVDVLTLSDRVVAEVDGVEGIRCVPLNRTIVAMRSLQLSGVTSDRDARALMDVLQVEGLVVGTVTAYEPYRPLRLGIAAQAYTTEQTAPSASQLDELVLATGAAEIDERAALQTGPSSQMSRVYDAKNHEVLADLKAYSTGRYAPRSGAREHLYTMSMDAYTSFVAFEVVRELVEGEAARFAPRPEESSVAAVRQ